MRRDKIEQTPVRAGRLVDSDSNARAGGDFRGRRQAPSVPAPWFTQKGSSLPCLKSILRNAAGFLGSTNLNSLLPVMY